MVASIVNANGFTEKKVRPADVIPEMFRYPEPPPRTLTPEEKASESRRAWKYMDKYFAGKGRKKRFTTKPKEQ